MPTFWRSGFLLSFRGRQKIRDHCFSKQYAVVSIVPFIVFKISGGDNVLGKGKSRLGKVDPFAPPPPASTRKPTLHNSNRVWDNGYHTLLHVTWTTFNLNSNQLRTVSA